MISPERLKQLIDFHENNLSSMDTFAEMFGGPGNPMVETTKKVATDLTRDTIQALREYADMISIKKIVDGG